MLKIFALVGGLLFACSQVTAQTPGASTHTIARFDGSQIQYHLDRRGQRKKQAIMLFLQGSDCNSVHDHPGVDGYLAIAPNHAVLMVEKYGITSNLAWSEDDLRADCPIDYLKNNSLQQRVLDALQVVAHMRRTATWWDGRLLVVGGSAGTLVASQVATMTPETKQLVIFGFGSRYFKQDLFDSIASSMASEGVPESVVEAELADVKAQFESMRENPSPRMFASGHSFAYWASMWRFDQYESLAQVVVPILAVQGARDQNVSPQGARELVKALEENANTQLDFFEYAELDHGFRDQAGVSEKQRVVMDIARWIKQHN